MSLEKKILDQIAKDRKKMGGDLAYWMDSRKFLEELGVVAQKIREKIQYWEKESKQTGRFLIAQELEEVLGLLVEEKKP